MHPTRFVSQLFHHAVHTADSVFGERDVQSDDPRRGRLHARLRRDNEHPGLAQEENREKDSCRVEVRD